MRGKKPKTTKVKKKVFPKKIFLSDLVSKIWILFVFNNILWWISSNWCVEKFIAPELHSKKIPRALFIKMFEDIFNFFVAGQLNLVTLGVLYWILVRLTTRQGVKARAKIQQVTPKYSTKIQGNSTPPYNSHRKIHGKEIFDEWWWKLDG